MAEPGQAVAACDIGSGRLSGQPLTVPDGLPQWRLRNAIPRHADCHQRCVIAVTGLPQSEPYSRIGTAPGAPGHVRVSRPRLQERPELPTRRPEGSGAGKTGPK